MKWPWKDKRLGIALERGHYDLPLNQDEGTNFLKLLIALMSFLAVVALASSFALGTMTNRWSSGLENKLTIEIPAEKESGDIRTKEEMSALQERVSDILENDINVKNIEILDEADIQGLVEPWLGKNTALNDIPLPGLISVELVSSDPEKLDKIAGGIKAISNDIVLDTHESWLQGLLRLTSSLRIAAFVVVFIIAATTVTAVAGAIRSRIALHRADVELLHLMGANDEYIVRQFQRHALIITLQGSIAGTVAGIAILIMVRLFSMTQSASILPGLGIGIVHTLIILIMPLLACGIAALAARFTVLRALSLMP